MHMEWQGWGMGGGWFFMAVFWVLVIAAIAVVVVSVMKKAGGGGKDESALDILKKRYARGEITRDEYGSMKKDIEGG